VSVINKMLRDLDHRQDTSSPLAAAGATPAQTALRQGTASVAFGKPPVNQKSGRNSVLWPGLGLLVLAALAAGAWLWLQADTAGPRLDTASAPPAAAAAPTSAPVAATAASEPTAAPQAGASSVEAVPRPDPVDAVPGNPPAPPGTNAPATAMTLRMEPSLSARRALDAMLSTPPVPVATPVSPAAPPTPVATAAVAAVAADHPKPRLPVSTAAATSAPASDSVRTMQRMQQAGGDAMAQVQNLWNSGSHDAAMDLMQQSIAAAERSAKAGGGGTVLAPLVREMARMQLAEGRFGAVWEMLTRLEPLLGNQPDLWAIRANAAQRLGRHQDSVHAYMMALQSRPDEQRWLLGTAVSLAALGQTSSAAEMAEKARAVGPVSKDIQTYLRQAGVPLKEQ